MITPSTLRPVTDKALKFYIETYGCQMNFGDTEIVVSIMRDNGYIYVEKMEEADIVLVNTCSIRDNAEQRVWGRLSEFAALKRRRPALIVGVIGCMAERLKERLVEADKGVDIVAGPDSYRSLPSLMEEVKSGGKGINVLLSREETYADISPVRLDRNGVSAFVSIMRGCNNMCSYCVVPYTRGGERSRDSDTILAEVRDLFDRGYREVTLLGQNVNSYRYGDTTFADLMRMTAEVSPLLRVRFATSHPKDLSDELLKVMAAHPNICRSIHLPAQSGSDTMLERMNRKYTRGWYLERIDAIRRHMPDCAITTDIIAGFCGETQEEHSEREGTKASRHMKDDIDDETKTRRLTEIINLQNDLSLESNRQDIGKTFEVLVEGPSKRNPDELVGRTSQNKVCVFADTVHSPGDYVTVQVDDCTSATLLCHRV